ncbi:MAG TPA: class I SAM-dependent rRNA methyltransferase, partial [Fermentimonas caenicola]|nr:class I SAM-dependent rRNA methyltransferase [Fermentimonas caenicola]
MNTYKEVVLKPKKDEFLKRFHPWVFSGAVAYKSKEIEEGEIVKVLSHEKEFLGVGHYQIGSISVRILSFKDVVINVDYYIERLSEAYKMRKHIGLINSENNTYRLVHGEGDNLPGLIIDIYGNTAVLQAHSVGMHSDREKISEALRAVYGSDNLK